jgi:LysM repeat protein
MNKEDPYLEKIDQTLNGIEQTSPELEALAKELPPRGDTHREKTKKGKWKINYPIIRLLVLFFILLPITMFCIYSYYEGDIFPDTKKVNEEKVGYERVAVGKMKEVEEAELEIKEDPILNEAPNNDAVETVVIPSKETNSSDSKVSNTIPSDTPNNEPTSDAGTISTDIPAETVKNPVEKTTYHTVVAGETLYRIALKYYHSKSGIEIIKQANQIKGNEIHNGQKLIIPLD